jgi:hypothetical protein
MVPADRGPRTVTCADDEPAPGPERPGSPRLDLGLFLGRWENTDAGTRGFREVEMSDRDGGLLLEIDLAASPLDRRRCEVLAEPFAEHPVGAIATQFHASSAATGQPMRMHGWVKLGVLVIAIFRRPGDSPAEAPWFDREFFSQRDRP